MSSSSSAPNAIGEVSGKVFFVWFSVFNLFATMVFWALMADRFSLEQSKRLFGTISVGGTLGAIVGPWLASLLVASARDGGAAPGGGDLARARGGRRMGRNATRAPEAGGD